jgi:hypothetical protein
MQSMPPSRQRLVDERQDAGEYTVAWHGTYESGAQVASGVYLVRLDAVGETRVVQATLPK